MFTEATTAKDPKTLEYGYFDRMHGEVQYILLGSSETHMGRDICVFTNSRTPRTSNSVFDSKKIISLICQRERLDCRKIIFLDLQTHTGHNSIPSGHYMLESLTIRADGPHDCTEVLAWRGFECPLAVFKTFEQFIGPFPILRDIITPARSCYKDFTEEQLREEHDWAVGHLKWREECYARTRERLHDRLRSPEQAFEMGYRFAPNLVHRDDFLDAELLSSDSLAVDLTGSHLLGQYGTFRPQAALGQPSPFAFWWAETSEFARMPLYG
jgi:hypothetical protein